MRAILSALAAASFLLSIVPVEAELPWKDHYYFVKYSVHDYPAFYFVSKGKPLTEGDFFVFQRCDDNQPIKELRLKISITDGYALEDIGTDPLAAQVRAGVLEKAYARDAATNN